MKNCDATRTLARRGANANASKIVVPEMNLKNAPQRSHKTKREPRAANRETTKKKKNNIYNIAGQFGVRLSNARVTVIQSELTIENGFARS